MKKLIIGFAIACSIGLASCGGCHRNYGQPMVGGGYNDYPVYNTPYGQQVVVQQGGHSMLMDYLLFQSLMGRPGGYTNINNYYNTNRSSFRSYDANQARSWGRVNTSNASWRSKPGTSSGWKTTSTNTPTNNGWKTSTSTPNHASTSRSWGSGSLSTPSRSVNSNSSRSWGSGSSSSRSSSSRSWGGSSSRSSGSRSWGGSSSGRRR
jgi:hypothetical protein